MPEHKKKNILVAPLDWGLGHTTRCIPVIYELMEQGAAVLVAGNDIQVQLLKKEFPQIRYLHLDGYNVQYAEKKNRFLINLLKQAPYILKTIRREHRWLKQAVVQHAIDGVISDNRFGLYHATLPTVFITHQLRVKNPLGKNMEALTQRMNYRWIEKFSGCWIPDYATAPGMAGTLSHPVRMPSVPYEYIGPLSRMKRLTDVPATEKGLLILLSGPEPQRSLFEKIIWEQLGSSGRNAVLVRGLPKGGGPPLPALEAVTVYDHLPAQELNRLMCAADCIVCRSGYSSLMDIEAIGGARSILVPTPGQTEQEYLATLFDLNKKAVTSTQDAFDLELQLSKAGMLEIPALRSGSGSGLKEAVSGFLISGDKRER